MAEQMSSTIDRDQEIPEAQATCPKCGQEVPAGKFCDQCGAGLEKTEKVSTEGQEDKK